MSGAASAVLYHYPCPDGSFAALAAHLYFQATSCPALFFPNPVYDPVRVENLPCDDFQDVYLLDFIGPPGFVEEISSKVPSVIILDHHMTALEILGETTTGKNVTKIIDVNRSGATIAYDFFKDKLLRRKIGVEHDVGSQLVPESEFERLYGLFKYIEDGDLWRWAIPDSKAFSSGLNDLHIEYDVRLNPTLFKQLLALDPQVVINLGQMMLSHKQKLIDIVLEQSYEIALGGGLFGCCLAVNADSISDLRSELGHQLANKSHDLQLRGIGAVVYRVPELNNEQLLKISLRSVEGDDTILVSQEYGGGGHRNASSFMLSSAEFGKWKIAAKSLL